MEKSLTENEISNTRTRPPPQVICFCYLYFIVNMSYKIHYTLHTFDTEQKHSLHDLSTNSSVCVKKRFQYRKRAAFFLSLPAISCNYYILPL